MLHVQWVIWFLDLMFCLNMAKLFAVLISSPRLFECKLPLNFNEFVFALNICTKCTKSIEFVPNFCDLQVEAHRKVETIFSEIFGVYSSLETVFQPSCWKSQPPVGKLPASPLESPFNLEFIVYLTMFKFGKNPEKCKIITVFYKSQWEKGSWVHYL